MQASLQPEILLELVQMKMPFGKYKDTLLCNLPVSYLEWFARKGFPPRQPDTGTSRRLVSCSRSHAPH